MGLRISVFYYAVNSEGNLKAKVTLDGRRGEKQKKMQSSATVVMSCVLFLGFLLSFILASLSHLTVF